MAKSKEDPVQKVNVYIEAVPSPGVPKNELSKLPDPKTFYKKFIAQFLKSLPRTDKPTRGPSTKL